MSRIPERLNKAYLEEQLKKSTELAVALLKLLHSLAQPAWQYEEVRFLVKLTTVVLISMLILTATLAAIHEDSQTFSATGQNSDDAPYVEGGFHSQYENQQARAGKDAHILEHILNASEFYNLELFLETVVTTRSLAEPIDVEKVRGIFEFLQQAAVPDGYFFRIISSFDIENTQFQLAIDSDGLVVTFSAYDPNLLRSSLVAEGQEAIDGYEQVSRDTKTTEHAVHVEVFKDSAWKDIQFAEPYTPAPFVWPAGVEVDLSFQGEYEIQQSHSLSSGTDRGPMQRATKYTISLKNREQQVGEGEQEDDRVLVFEFSRVEYFRADGSVGIGYGFYGAYTNDDFIELPMVGITDSGDPTSERLFAELKGIFSSAVLP
jgi:hypothetical protein